MVMYFILFDTIVYTLENRIVVTDFWTKSQTSATNVTSSLQHAHSEAFFQNAPEE